MQNENIIGVWRAKRGNVNISNMANNHLQSALESAERRYKRHTELSLDHADASTLLFEKIMELRAEAKVRDLKLVSLAEQEPGMHKFLVNAFKIENMIS